MLYIKVFKVNFEYVSIDIWNIQIGYFSFEVYIKKVLLKYDEFPRYISHI